MRAEFGGRGIGVSAICPGLIRTNLAANGTRGGADERASAAWAARLGGLHRYVGRSPDTVAAAVERAVRWNLSTVPVGAEAWAGWYLYRLSPSLMRGLTGLFSMSFVDAATERVGTVLGGAR